MNEKTLNKLIEKIKNDGGDEEFVNTLKETLESEIAGATKSKNDYFRIERMVIIFSMLASICAGISATDFSIWGDTYAPIAKFIVDIFNVSFPAVVTALVASRGIKRSFETWIRHRKYHLSFSLLINDYLYGSKEFNANGDTNYILFRDKVQELYQQSMDEFLNSMKK